MKKTKRIGIKSKMPRADVEWTIFFDPYEYVLLDRMIFRSHLNKANNGEGWKFHIRTLARETNMSSGKASSVVKGWNFVTKIGEGQDSHFVFEMDKFKGFLQAKMDAYYAKTDAPKGSQSVQVVNIGVRAVNEGVQDANKGCLSSEQGCLGGEPIKNTKKINEKEEKKEEVKQIGIIETKLEEFDRIFGTTSVEIPREYTAEELKKMNPDEIAKAFDEVFETG
jgi:hypothetical protein